MLVEITTKEGCILRDLYTTDAKRSTVEAYVLNLKGTCTERQQAINDLEVSRQGENGPKRWRLIKLDSLGDLDPSLEVLR